MGNAYLEFKIRVRKADNTNLIVATKITKKVIRLVNNGFAFKIHGAKVQYHLELEQNKTNMSDLYQLQ